MILKNSYKDLLLIFGIILCVFLADWGSKQAVMSFFKATNQPYIEILPFFNLAFVWNYGVSFGMFQAETGLGVWFLRLFAIAITSFLVYLLLTASSKLGKWGYTLVLGGAAGNIYDRFVYGAVFDFLDFHAFGWHFWTFNIADCAITLGAIAILGETFYEWKDKNQNIHNKIQDIKE